MKLSHLLFTLAVAGILMVSCIPSGKKSEETNYINDHGYGTNISALLGQASKSIYRVEFTTIFRAGGQKTRATVVGIAFAVDDRHLFTARHITYLDYYNVSSPFGLLSMPIEKENRIKDEMFILRDDGSKWPVKVIYRNKSHDFAVLESMHNLVDPIYTIGDSDKIRLLDTVIVLSDFGAGLGARVGHISQLSIINYEKMKKVKSIRYNYFGFTAVINNGDSGSPVFVMKNGRLEIAGITSFIIPPIHGIGYGAKITPLIELLLGHGEHKSWVLPLLK